MNKSELISRKFDLPFNMTKMAVKNIKEGKVRFIAVSGKIGSGKDTIAPLLMEALGVKESNRTQEYFARPLKKEMQEVIEIIREEYKLSKSNHEPNDSLEALFAKTRLKDKTIYEIASKMDVPVLQAAEIFGFIRNEVIEDETLTSYSRTIGIRKALQHWGTEVRRAQNPDYWVMRAMQPAYENLSKGTSVYITDNRFVNEVEGASFALATIVRLDVSEEEQAKRIRNRDNVEISDDARNHPSETSLDNYDKFDVRVLTDNKTPEEVVTEILAKLK